MTWQVEQAQTPPQAWSRPALRPSEKSRMLPGRPLWPYGTFSGSTSMVLPLGRNVTLYFFVAAFYFISLLLRVFPPLIFPLFFCPPIPPRTGATRAAPPQTKTQTPPALAPRPPAAPLS